VPGSAYVADLKEMVNTGKLDPDAPERCARMKMSVSSMCGR
jgi:hypothetical protein